MRASRLTGTTQLPNFTPPSVIGTSTRFMAGEPMKPATKRLAGRSYMLRGRVDLLEQTVLEHRHAVAHRHGLDLVVGDVDGGDAEAALEATRSAYASRRGAWRRGSTAARP